MEDVGHLVPSLQVSVLAALCFDEEWGAEIASQVKPTHFDSIYRDFVTVLLRYRREYKTPPGEVQLLTLAFDAALNNESKTFYTESLVPTLVAEATKFNARFAASKVNDFIRRQQAKHALFEAGEAWDSERTGGPNAIPRIERAFHDFLFAPRGRFDAGTSLSDPRALNFLDKRLQEEFIPLGIKEFDAAGIGLYPKQLLLYIAAKGCLVGDTLIDCPRDLVKYPRGIPIRELVGKQFWTYSWDFSKQSVVLARVTDVWSSGFKPVYRVKLAARRFGIRGGGVGRPRYQPPEELVGTYDHPVLMSDGSWKKLGELCVGDSLKSLYRRVEGARGYSCLTWTGLEGTSVREHRFICGELGGERDARIHAHHIDGNSLNHNVDNLQWLDGKEHASRHLQKANLLCLTGWQKTGVHPRGMLGKKHSFNTKHKIGRASKLSVASAKKSDPNEMIRRGRLGGRLLNHKVLSVEYVGVRETFDMEVEDTSNFVANGVFVHNSGKTWFCVHCGVQTLLHHGKVVHYTLEEDGDDGIIPRYCQALFGLGQNGDPYTTSVFSKESKEGEKFWTTVTRTPDKHFGSTNIKKFLQRELKKFDAHFERLIVKTVPSGKFTVDELVSHLDYLEYAQGFVPNLVIVDYPKLMRQDPNNLRISLGQTVVDLRAVAQERNMAFLCPHQGTRKTIRAARVHSSDAGEDISVVQTADTVLAYQRTIMEENRGMARLSVEHSRRTRSGWMLWLSQSYAIGKFVNESKRVAERDLEQPMQGERDDTEGGS